IMGVCIAPAFEKKFRGSDSFSKLTEGKCLVYCLDRLDDTCRRHGLSTLSSFAPDYDALACQLPKGEKLKEIWFESADGLKTVSELLKILSLDKKWFNGLAVTKKDAKLAVECLEVLERLLRSAAKKKIRFYLFYF